MGSLIYSAITSLDGYIEDKRGTFDWAVPDDDVHAFINDLERDIGVYLYGRRLYETMVGWENDAALVDVSDVIRDYSQIWQAAEKVVYSTNLKTVSTTRTRIEPSFDAESVRQLKGSAERDLSIGGPGLAVHAFRAGLVDECRLFVAPVMVGGGKRALPDDVRLNLDLVDERRFESGVVYLRYRAAT